MSHELRSCDTYVISVRGAGLAGMRAAVHRCALPGDAAEAKQETAQTCVPVRRERDAHVGSRGACPGSFPEVRGTPLCPDPEYHLAESWRGTDTTPRSGWKTPTPARVGVGRHASRWRLAVRAVVCVCRARCSTRATRTPPVMCVAPRSCAPASAPTTLNFRLRWRRCVR